MKKEEERNISKFAVFIRRSHQFSAFSLCLLSLALCLFIPALGETTVEGIPCSSEPTNMPIEYGDLISCAIDISGDTDIFRFSGTTGEIIVLQAAWVSGGFPCVELYDPDGILIEEACANDFTNRVDTTLSKTGIHTILVKDWWGTEDGVYKLDLERIAPLPSNAQPIQYGDTIPEEINPGGDLDLYTFEGIQPDRIVLQAARISGGFPCVELYDPDGIFMEEACANTFTNRIDTTLSKTGAHTILVKDWWGTDDGEYSLSLQCIGVCEMHALTVDTVGTGSGTVTSSDGRINCGSDCGAIYNAGAAVTLTADGAPDSIFEGWSGGGCSGTGICEIIMNADAAVTATFTKTPGTVTLLTPNGGEHIPTGSSYPICWEAPSSAVKFKLKYSMDNGMTWILIEDNVIDTCYDWLVPKQWGNKKRCLVKVIGYNASDLKVGADVSNAPFTIEVIKLTSPDGGETLESGSIHTINWQTNGTKNPVAKVKLLYTNDGGIIWNLINTLPGNPGSFDWEVPCVKGTRYNCKVKVMLIDVFGNILGQDASNDYFTIVPSCADIAGSWPFSDSGTITCTYNGYTEKAPIGGDGSVTIYQNGCNVSWSVSGISDINETRKGTICGNSLKVSGKFCVPLTSGVTLTENQYTAKGIVSGGEINGNGSGVCSGSYQGINFSCWGKDTFVISLDVFGTIDQKKVVREPSPVFMNNSLGIFPALSP